MRCSTLSISIATHSLATPGIPSAYEHCRIWPILHQKLWETYLVSAGLRVGMKDLVALKFPAIFWGSKLTRGRYGNTCRAMARAIIWELLASWKRTSQQCSRFPRCEQWCLGNDGVGNGERRRLRPQTKHENSRNLKIGMSLRNEKGQIKFVGQESCGERAE